MEINAADFKELIRSVILLTCIASPFFVVILMLWKGIVNGFKGEDGKMDKEEIKDLFRLMILIGFFVVFAFMLLSKGMYKYEYGINDYILAYAGTIEAGILVILQYLKRK